MKMSKLPKRVWNGKKLVFSGKKAVWEKDGEIGVYDPKFKTIDSGEVYTNKRIELDGTAELDIYDSMKPTFIGTLEDGVEATYIFYDYDEETVLGSGTCKDGETPETPENPTREGYTFTGWDPTVGPIYKDTSYVAQYEANEPEEPEEEPEEESVEEPEEPVEESTEENNE